MWRKLPGDWYLSGTVPADAEALVRHLDDGQVARWLLRVPQPYRLEDARRFLDMVGALETEARRTLHFAVRDREGMLVGMVGLNGAPPAHTPSPEPVELGFWIAAPYWRRGVGTEAVRRVVNIALVEYEIDTLVAGVLEGNQGSVKVLSRNGFELSEERVNLSLDASPRWGARYRLTYERYAALAKEQKKV